MNASDQADSDLGLNYSDFGLPKPTEPDIRQQLKPIIISFGRNIVQSMNPQNFGDEAVFLSENEALDALEALISQTVSSSEKAYGGCHKCYGKGYATVISGIKGFADLGNDSFVGKPHERMKFCTCDRGNALKRLLGSDV